MTTARKVRRSILVAGSFLLAIALPTPIPAQAPAATAGTGPHAKTLYDSAKRVLFDTSAFEGASTPLPYWDKGFLISREEETSQPGVPNVRVYEQTGAKIREATFWFPESQRMFIASAAVTSNGRILASGVAEKADGTRAKFIALADLNGNVASVIQTGDFHPRNLCEAPDGSVWAYGGTGWDEKSGRPNPGEILRRFDFQKGQIATYISRSEFPDRIQHEGGGTHIRCTSEAVILYSSGANLFAELTYGNAAPQMYRVLGPPGLSAIGFAILRPREVFGFLAGGSSSSANGLYYLVFDETAKTVRWMPVQDAVSPGKQLGRVTLLLGADGDKLVLNRAGDPAGWAGVNWAVPLDQ